jgi:hypothetical protein
MRLQNIKIGSYLFYVQDNEVFVQYVGAGDRNTVKLSSLTVETIGVTKDNKGGYMVTLITPASIQKLKNNLTENLEVVGYPAKTLKEALALVTFLAEWFDYLKDKDDTNSE